MNPQSDHGREIAISLLECLKDSPFDPWGTPILIAAQLYLEGFNSNGLGSVARWWHAEEARSLIRKQETMNTQTHNRLILAAVIVLAVIAVYLFFQVENAG